MDFFPPIAEDPYLFGQIAAANALSDIYAMGGEPKLALNLFSFPSCMPEQMIKDILRGGFDKVFEAGAVLCGGHTIYDDVPKYGLAVNGFAHPDKILKNSGAKPDDLLILTKPLGSGIITTAAKGDFVEKKELEHAYAVMAFLNAAAKNVMMKYTVNACTDITGFGLLGHAYEMAKNSGVTIEIAYEALPAFPSAIENAKMGLLSAGVYSNREFAGEHIEFEDVPVCYQDLMFDPQTSGGLLISAPEKEAEKMYAELCKVLENTVCGKPAVIGKVTCPGKTAIKVRKTF